MGGVYSPPLFLLFAFKLAKKALLLEPKENNTL